VGKLKIGIDPGHGGRDPGAVSPVRPSLNDQLYTEEAYVTLAIAKRLQGILLACGYEVIITRTDDTNISLNSRSNVLNQAGCDIAISIHLNSSTVSEPDYIATYIQATGGLAEKLAQCIQPRLVQITGWPDGGIRVSNLHMTRETFMPAVLVELGFVSNPQDEIQLNDPGVQGKLAAAIAEGTMIYAGELQPWQRNLLTYAADPTVGQTEIARAGEVWKKRTVVGDTAGADAAHQWANTIRCVIDLI